RHHPSAPSRPLGQSLCGDASPFWETNYLAREPFRRSMPASRATAEGDRRSDASPLTAPRYLFASDAESLGKEAAAGLAECRQRLEEILGRGRPRTIENLLVPYDRLLSGLSELQGQSRFLFDVHPNAAVRETADKWYQEAERFATDLARTRRQDYDHDEVPGHHPRLPICPGPGGPAAPPMGAPEPRPSREPRDAVQAHGHAPRTRAGPRTRELRGLHRTGQDDRIREGHRRLPREGPRRLGGTGEGGLRDPDRPQAEGRAERDLAPGMGHELLFRTRARGEFRL